MELFIAILAQTDTSTRHSVAVMLSSIGTANHVPATAPTALPRPFASLATQATYSAPSINAK